MRLPFLNRRAGRRGFREIGRESPIRLSFEKFHQLLECNNHVLEIIAEMEEMLNGDYLFDKNYLDSTCEKLSVLISKIVYYLNVIGRGEYIKIINVSESIKQLIEAELSDEPLDSGDHYVVRFRNLDRSKSGLAGSKASVLGELRSKFRNHIPPGFVITTQAYRRFIEANKLKDDIEKSLDILRQEKDASLEEISASIEGIILDAHVPSDIGDMIEDAADRLDAEWKSDDPRYAIRSSAVGEDTQLSFAGQYSSFLNIRREDIIHYYKRVMASLFSYNALSYRKRNNILYMQSPMAVAVMPMLDPSCSGVMYSVDPNWPESDNVVISGAWGLGQMAAEGGGKSDYYIVSKAKPHIPERCTIARKREAYEPRDDGGISREVISSERQSQACLPNEDLARLADLALKIERYLGGPQDMEWTVDKSGTAYILQARPLLISDSSLPDESEALQSRESYPILFQGKGVVASRGVGAGKAYHIFPSDSGADFPEGGVLIARSTSPRLSSLIGRASAVVTDIGTPTGHMATIAREFHVPMLVDVGDATRLIPRGAEVTVDASTKTIYSGTVPNLAHPKPARGDPFTESSEFCKLRNILRYVAPLHLTDPRNKSEFIASKCRSYHDIIRFAHEMVVNELIDMNLTGGRRKASSAKRLNCELPIGLIIIDVGNGLRVEANRATVEIDDIDCIPLRRVLEGLLSPGVWSTQPVPLTFRDFMSGVGHTGDPATASQPKFGSRSLAIISESYLNLSLRFGYHFNMVDCLASENRSANYIYFRFVGGITEKARRKRRAQFLANVLRNYDFSVEIRGDLVIARLTKLSLPMMEKRLHMVGRLIGFSRQLDIFMKSDEIVDDYTREFLSGDSRKPQ